MLRRFILSLRTCVSVGVSGIANQGRGIGPFPIYNTISWQIELAESGGPPNVIADLVSNPLDTATWEADASKLADIPFAWLGSVDRVYELERARERLTGPS